MKYPAEIENFVGKEVFFVGLDGDSDEIGDFDTFHTLEGLNKHLENVNPYAEQNLTVVHGYLTSAECIPEEIGRGVYLIVTSPDEIDTGCIYEFTSADPNKLAELIEEILERDKDGLEKVTIDDIFILYGYEISLGCTVRDEELDSELLDTSEQIADVAKKMKEKVMEVGEE